jgi:hypothetical protein
MTQNFPFLFVKIRFLGGSAKFRFKLLYSGTCFTEIVLQYRVLSFSGRFSTSKVRIFS